MSKKGYFGLQGIGSAAGELNAHQFQIDQSLWALRTAIPVEVKAVYGGGEGSIPSVDVVPLVNQVDGIGNMTQHATIFNIPCIRIHGGGNAIIADPAVGDVGHMIISDRDISTIKKTWKQGPPGSRRKHSLADGVYHGAMFGSAAQAVEFKSTGVKIYDKNGNIIEMSAGQIKVTGNLLVTGEVIAGYGGADQVGLQTHKHKQGNDSGGNVEADTAAPTAGT